MGAFFTNYQVRSNSSEDVIRVVTASAGGRAYVSSPKNGWVTLYDEVSDDQDQRELQRLARILSKELSTSVFAFLDHDSDILMYFLYERGWLVDEYNSNPDYFEEEDDEARKHWRGNAGAVLKHCVSGTRVEDIENIIHRADEYGFAEEMLDDLAPLLGIDPMRLRFGFNYFKDEAAESLEDAEAFRPVGKGVTDAEAAESQKRIKDAAAAAGPRAASGPQPRDLYCMALGMIISARCSSIVPQGMPAMFGFDSEAMRAGIRKKMDSSIKRMLKPCPTPEWPSAEMLLAAADRGPADLARLVATATPQVLDQATVQASMYDLAWLRAFVEAGGNVNTITERGQSALVTAIAKKKNDNVAYLLKAGADPNAKRPDGETPLGFALHTKQLNIAELLQQYGAKE